MPDSEAEETLVRADRLSKVVALFVAIAVFLAASSLTGEALFAMTVAAFAGIGARIYVPYHASVTVSDPDPDPDPKPIREFEGTGNYHQGAFGVALVLGAVAALASMVVLGDTWRALGAGLGAAVVLFSLLRTVLPS